MRSRQIGDKLPPRAEIFPARIANFQVFLPESLPIHGQSPFDEIKGYFGTQMHFRHCSCLYSARHCQACTSATRCSGLLSNGSRSLPFLRISQMRLSIRQCFSFFFVPFLFLRPFGSRLKSGRYENDRCSSGSSACDPVRCRSTRRYPVKNHRAFRR